MNICACAQEKLFLCTGKNAEAHSNKKTEQLRK